LGSAHLPSAAASGPAELLPGAAAADLLGPPALAASELPATPAREVLAPLLGAAAKLLARLDRLRIAPAVVTLLCPLVPVLDPASVLRVVLPLRSIALTLRLAALTLLRAVGPLGRPVHVLRVVLVVAVVDVHVAATPVAVAPDRRPHC